MPASFKDIDTNCGGCNVKIGFNKAEQGRFVFSGQQIKGVMLQLNFSVGSNQCTTGVKILQFVRKVEYDGKGNPIARATSSGGSGHHINRRDGASGWMIDQLIGDDFFKIAHGSPYYSDSQFGGMSNTSGWMLDTPGVRNSEPSVGREFYTCLVCPGSDADIANVTTKYLGCLHWGFKPDPNDPTMAVFEPSPPTFQCGKPPQGTEGWNSGTDPAVAKWNTNVANNRYLPVQ